MMKTKASRPNKLLRIIGTPYRALCRARDFYVTSMINCANMNATAMQRSSMGPSLPRSFSAASSRSNDDEDYRELVRAASARSMGGRADLDVHVAKVKVGGGPRVMPPRSASVAMVRIDEDGPCSYFGEDGNVKIADVKNGLIYPRSKSHAVARTAF